MIDKVLQNSKKERSRRPVAFCENACYDVKQVSQIINRSERYVRAACRRKLIRCRAERGGFLISGWSIRDFIECRCDIE